MPWKDNRNRSKTKITRCVALLLGGTIYDSAGEGVRIVKHGRHKDDESQRTVKDIEKDIFVWERDFRTLTSLFERYGFTVWRSIPAALECSKFDTMEQIMAFFTHDDVRRQQQGMSYSEVTNFVIYWCGHGFPNTGDWAFSEGGALTCKDLIDLWNLVDRYEHDTLTIFSDSCFSGAWIDELEKMDVKNIAYQAACRSDETAWVVDREVPRSLLMRPFLLEAQEATARADNYSWQWICPIQHPVFYSSYGHDEIQETEYGRCLMIKGGFRLFTIDNHTKTRQNYAQSEKNGTVKHIQMLKVVKR